MIRPCFALFVLLAACTSAADAPHIDSVNPSSAGIGDTVVLTGSKFCDGVDCTTVTTVVEIDFNNPIMLGIDSISDTQLEAVVLGQGVIPGPTEMLIEVNGQASNTVPFTVE